MNYGLQMLMGLQTFIKYGLQILMGLQTFINYGLQILMGMQTYELWAANISGSRLKWESLEQRRLKTRVVMVWFGLCCLMTPGLSKDIQCHA